MNPILGLSHVAGRPEELGKDRVERGREADAGIAGRDAQQGNVDVVVLLESIDKRRAFGGRDFPVDSNVAHVGLHQLRLQLFDDLHVVSKDHDLAHRLRDAMVLRLGAGQHLPLPELEELRDPPTNRGDLRPAREGPKLHHERIPLRLQLEHLSRSPAAEALVALRSRLQGDFQLLHLLAVFVHLGADVACGFHGGEDAMLCRQVLGQHVSL
mmetsp:Transcript_6115/g.23780  ORF Transcript_6115/g.23780 Transcript_6115/m.23780 type:complete len:212 (-) Transcript_6115:595-1230(-)